MITRKWKDEVLDSKEKKVFEALADPKWDFRTVEGLVKSTKLSPEEIKKIIQKHPELIRKSTVPDRYGRQLYTLREKNTETLELFQKLRTFISKSI